MAPVERAWRTRASDQMRSVRTRIVLALVVVTAICLGGAGVVAYELESKRVEHAARVAITNEMHHFDALMKAGVDPRTQQPFTSVADGMHIALVRTTTVQNEVIVAYANRRALFREGSVGGYRLDKDPKFQSIVKALYYRGGTRDLATPEGRAIVAVKPVSSRREVGAYVVTFFVDREAAPFKSAMRTYALIALGLIAVVSALAWLIAGRLLRPIRLLRETAHDISHTDLSRRIAIDSRDELGDLATTFNAMLDRLESSFADQRRFLDDAGHELRTPITIVRGHLELTNPGDPADVEATRALAIDELDRMARLVDDLILLAKAERPDFVRPEAFEAGALTDDVFDKVRAIDDRRWVVDHRAEGDVVADPQRLTQALVQLATNAVAHTSAGDEIGVGSRVLPDAVQWWVRDTGPGVRAEHRDEIFERFARGPDAADMEGSGLGLSIVRAIARAHGGDVTLVDATVIHPGHGSSGATFVITIPRHPPLAVTKQQLATGADASATEGRTVEVP
jgi:signal transduction histidine kinase